MDDGRICGMARLHGEAFGNAEQLRKGLRAWAKGDRATAARLMPATFQRGPGSAVCVEAGAYLHAMLAREASAGSDAAVAAAREALLTKASELDGWIANPSGFDAAMWSARSMVERSQAAVALDDAAMAATLVRNAIDALSGLWGPEHLEVGNYWDDLATALFALGQSDAAEAAVARARAIREKHGFPYGGLG